MGSEDDLTMYNDNAWPDTAPIQTFIKERKRPQRVMVAMIATLSAGGGALLAGLLHLATEGNGSSVLSGMTSGVTVVLGLAVAAWAGILAKPVYKGSKWSLRPAQWTGGSAAVLFALYGLLAKPQGSAPLSWIEALFAFLAAAGGLIAVLCLLGRAISEFFDPPVEAAPFDGGNQASLGGRDADWIPPEQRQQPPGGFLS